MKELAGKAALITGAASGIGRGVALELAREGSKLILVDVDDAGLGMVAGEVEGAGAEAYTFRVDVSDWDRVKEMSETVLTRWGPPDILVNNAGIAMSCDLVFTTVEDWRRIIGINLMGPIHFVNAFIPSMMKRGSGHVVNVSSGQAFFAVPCWGAYATTKYAVDGFSDALRYECKRHGIGVTTVYPAVVQTRFYDGVEGNFWTRLGLRVIPYVAHKPSTLGKKIVRDIKRNKRRELVHPAVYLAFYFGRQLDLALEGLGRLVAYLIARRDE